MAAVIAADTKAGINRIRLEFKDPGTHSGNAAIRVLIESDWNLKAIEMNPLSLTIMRINRIRLEFKGG